jgi:hypothetical protein
LGYSRHMWERASGAQEGLGIRLQQRLQQVVHSNSKRNSSQCDKQGFNSQCNNHLPNSQCNNHLPNSHHNQR